MSLLTMICLPKTLTSDELLEILSRGHQIEETMCENYTKH